jgi:hypothetical protein
MILKTDLVSKVMTEIAPKYFDADEFSEVTKSRIGIFGMISETMGTIFENSVINNAIKSRERLTITASRETLIQEAASYPELQLPHALPASIQLFLGIPTSYLQANFLTSSTSIEFVLAADTVITISNIKFLLPYDIKVTGSWINNKFEFTSQYAVTGHNLLISNITPFLITSKRVVNSIEYILINVNVSQLEKTYQYYNVVETEAILLNGIDFKYTGQLTYFNIFYKETGSSDFTFVDKLDYFSKLTQPGKFVYYNDVVPGNIRLYIPDSFGFSFNSELRLDIYTTDGLKGNFVYRTGEVIVIPQSFEDVVDYTGSSFYPIVTSDSIGGIDTLSTDEIRRRVIEYKSTLRSVDTEQDLNNFFTQTDQIDNMVFIKKRIDVFEKQYTAFMIMRDTSGNIIPTNSLNMHLTEADIDVNYTSTQRRVIRPSAAYSLKTGENFLVVRNTTTLSSDTIIKGLEEDTTQFLFSSPYLIVINEDPPSVSFYLNSVDNSNIMLLEYTNEGASLQFIINKMALTRNAIAGEDKYYITLNLIPAGELPTGIVDSVGNIIDATKIKVYGFTYTDTTNDVIGGYFPMTVASYNKTDNYFVVTGELQTDDYITLVDQLRIINTVIPLGGTVAADHITDITNVRFGIGVYFYDGVFVEKGEYVDAIPDMATYGLVNIYSNKNDRSILMLDMTKMINSVVTFVDEGAGVISFDLKQVPLIRYSDLRSQVTRISDIIHNTNAIIASMLNLIKNNSSIDFKFYATYGRSKYFTMENTGIFLDRLNISLNFKIRINAALTDVSIVNDVRTLIKPLIEEINTLSATKSIYFSNIITQVENEFKYNQGRILAFELAKVNEYATLYQAIVNTTPALSLLTKDELLDYVAEFVKLDLDKINIEIIPV